MPTASTTLQTRATRTRKYRAPIPAISHKHPDPLEALKLKVIVKVLTTSQTLHEIAVGLGLPTEDAIDALADACLHLGRVLDLTIATTTSREAVTYE